MKEDGGEKARRVRVDEFTDLTYLRLYMWIRVSAEKDVVKECEPVWILCFWWLIDYYKLIRPKRCPINLVYCFQKCLICGPHFSKCSGCMYGLTLSFIFLYHLSPFNTVVIVVTRRLWDIIILHIGINLYNEFPIRCIAELLVTACNPKHSLHYWSVWHVKVWGVVIWITTWERIFCFLEDVAL